MRLFVWYAVIEVAALVAVVYWLGLGWTLLLLLLGAVVGMWLVRREGARAALAVAESVRGGRAPRSEPGRSGLHAELTDGALIGLAGLLILVPGLVSDVLGLLLVLPPTRALARTRLVRMVERRSRALRTVRIHTGGLVVDGSVVDGSVVDGSVVDGSVVPGPVQRRPPDQLPSLKN
jgi:UPF0716 protein FxsA